MPSEEILIKKVLLVLNGKPIEVVPVNTVRVNPNQEPWPSHWSIVHNAYEGATLVINE